MNENDFKYALVGHRDCMAYSFISCRYVPTKHIAYFLSFFLCLFSLFSYLYVGVPWPWAVRFRWASMDFHDDTGSWERFLLLYLRFTVISFHVVVWHFMPNFLGHCTYIMFLTMGVFTTSWWVVNQPIVMVIFLYAFYILMLVCILLLEAWHFMVYVFIIAIYCFIISRALFPCLV